MKYTPASTIIQDLCVNMISENGFDVEEIKSIDLNEWGKSIIDKLLFEGKVLFFDEVCPSTFLENHNENTISFSNFGEQFSCGGF